MDDVDFIKWDFIIPVVLAIVAGFSVVVSTVVVVSSAVDNVVNDVMSVVELSTVGASVLVVDVSPVNREYDLDISVQRLKKTVPTQTKVLYFHNLTYKYQACIIQTEMSSSVPLACSKRRPAGRIFG